MKILFVSHSSPMKEGGAETRTREVAFRMAALGHQVIVYCGKTNPDDPDLQEIRGVRIITKRTLPDWLLRRFPYPHYVSLAAANAFLMFHLFFYLRKEDFDVIREDIAPVPPSFLLSMIRVSPVSAQIAVVHNTPNGLKGWTKYYGVVFGLGGYVMDRLLRANQLKYDRIICDSKWFAEELQAYPGISSKVHYVPNGVDLRAFSKERDRSHDGEVRLLSVGRLVETKGHRYLIEALAQLKNERPRMKLDILGNGPLKESLLQLARHLNIAEIVTIRSPIGHDQMPELMTEYDLFVMPSSWEGQPVSLIEAMASRLPIVAYAIPAITALLDEESAVLAEKESVTDLAGKLHWAATHPSEVRNRAESAFRIAAMHDWDRTARQEIEGV